MRIAYLPLVAFALAASIAHAQPAPVVDALAPYAEVPADPTPHPADVDAEVVRLRAALVREVPNLVARTPERDREWIGLAQAALVAAGHALDRPQLLVVVDRSPQVQQLILVVARPDAPWTVLGGTKISTGQPGRRDYYITPTGVFLHTDAILGFRAQGTPNENGIRGFGSKGMRVWDFGWQPATKGWRADREQGDIRFLMHATDPDRLEQRLGRPASQGCVRVSAAMNRFLDRHGVLDADYERAARDDRRFRALLPADRTPGPLGGQALVVVDSSEVS